MNSAVLDLTILITVILTIVICFYIKTKDKE